jgi:hypothetical protein
MWHATIIKRGDSGRDYLREHIPHMRLERQKRRITPNVAVELLPNTEANAVNHHF